MIKKNLLKKEHLYNFGIFLIIIFGLYLRLKGFLTNPSFWHDECALAWNIRFKTFSELFGILKFNQMAPPLFMCSTKLLVNILGTSEYVFRLIPLIIGCAALPAFYLLAKKVLNKKSSTFIALLIFTINTAVLGYSFEFKPYIIDVFLTIIVLLFFITIDLERLSAKRALIYGMLLAIVPWVSFVSLFIIAGGFFALILKKFQENFIKKINLILPLGLSFLLYLKMFLANSYQNSSYLLNFWGDLFADKGIMKLLILLVKNIKYFFDPINFLLFALILFVLGIILLFKEKSKFAHISMTGFVLLIIASKFHLYPFAERLVLFLLPIFLLYITKPLDLISWNKKILSLIIILLFGCSFYPQIESAKNLLLAQKLNKDEYPREMLAFMSKKLKPKDIIYINTESAPEFEYYSTFYNFKNKIIQEKITSFVSKDEYIKKLNNLKQGYYWFYIPIDYLDTPYSVWIREWAQNKQVIEEYDIKSMYQSILLYVRVK